MRFNLPDNLLGGDLVWWREDGARHTLVTIRGNIEGHNHLEPGSLPAAILTFSWFDPAGEFHTAWRRRIATHETLFLDSRRIEEWIARPLDLPESLLAILVSAESAPSNELLNNYSRLYNLVDWFSDEGDLVSLHNDQSFTIARGARGGKVREFTEIVVLETSEARNYLVVLNGPFRQEGRGIELEARNHRNEIRRAVYEPPMAPFSLHKLHLRQLFPNFDRFCDGRHATISGRFESQGLFTRPYVMTEGRRLCGYHGGDKYQWLALPRFAQRHFGRGEVNPMVALHDSQLTTTVNLLNTHADLEDDFWVDARLYDEAGHLTAERERWLPARRNQLSRGEIADLLPDPTQPFTGHIALNFSDDAKPLFPRRLQALMEYRTPESAARVMAWSDIWNGRERLQELTVRLDRRITRFFWDDTLLLIPGRIFRSHYRIWHQPPITSYLSITNCGVAPDYDRTVNYRMLLDKGGGESLIYEGRLGPQATDYGPVEKYFPNVESFLAGQPVALAIVECEDDLAIMHLSRHARSGVYSAEHFMDGGVWHEGNYHSTCGS